MTSQMHIYRCGERGIMRTAVLLHHNNHVNNLFKNNKTLNRLAASTTNTTILIRFVSLPGAVVFCSVLLTNTSKFKMPATYKLTYFDVTALAEPIRFMFAYGGIQYEDVRVQIDQWPAIKSTMPFGQMPVLEINGKVYGQSLAIGRYVAKLVKLYGSSPEEELQIDSMVDNVNDVRLKIGQYKYEKDEAVKEKIYGPLVNETLPFLCGKLDEIVKENKGYFVNGKLSFADIFFVALLDYMNHMLKGDVIEKYPNLQKVKENVTAVPAIKEWIEKRPKNDF